MKDVDSGTTIAGRYRIVEIIGKGGRGTVYKAVDMRVNRIVALKVFGPAFLDRERFIVEANLLAQWSHADIVKTYDCGEAGDSVYLAMEYIEGRSLAEILADGKALDVDSAARLMRQVAVALQHAHKLGIVHRDVKPSNILISNDGRVLLSDFDLAIRLGESSLTEIGTIVGTPAYMSPEQATGRPIDARSDIFSLGAVLYRSLTGRTAFSGKSMADLLRNLVESDPLPPREFNANISPALQDVVLQALAKDPARRFSSMDQFLDALKKSVRISVRHWGPPWPDRRILEGLPKAHDLGQAATHNPNASFEDTHTLAGVHQTIDQRGIQTDNQTFLRDLPTTEPTSETTPYAATKPALDLLKREPSAVAWLLVLSGPLRGRQFRLTDTFTIGRAPIVDLRLTESDVSRQHAQIVLQNSRFYIRDLGSKGGTIVNSIRVPRQELRDRDEIRIGSTIMLFINAVSPEDLTSEVKHRLSDFDALWTELRRSVDYD